MFQLMSCKPPDPQEGGGFEATPNLEYNATIISPIIIVPPLLACGKSVTVKGFVPGARIRVFADGALIGDADGWDPEAQTFAVAPDLIKGQTITASQEFEGTESGPSPPVLVQDHTEVYPAGLPRPTFPQPYLYDCGVATVVGELPPGGSLRVLSGPPASLPVAVIGQAVGVAAGQSVGISPPFNERHLVTAVSQICSDISPRADEQVVQAAPRSLPTPEVTAIYPGGTIISIHKLVNGASVTIKRGGTVIAGGGAPGSHVNFPMRVPVAAGDVLEIIQELCGVASPPGSVVVQACSALPPAKILAPRAGDDVVYLSDIVIGSRIRIFSGGQEIGDGGGSAIQLTRPLVDNEILIVVQSVGNCISSTSNVVQVGHGLDDPSMAGPCGRVLQFEYGHPADPQRKTIDITPYFNSPQWNVSVRMDAVPLHGIVRYPDGPGPFPLILIVHGNRDATQPSYTGFNYLLDHFASHCMIAVSVEEDFINGPSNDEMDGRAIVLLRNLQLWREWNRTPGHQFYGKIQESSIGLAGHSRGGEAVALAKLFNHTLHNPSDPDHDFNFGIRAVGAMAPTDFNFQTGPVVLNGADYYVIQGSHDGELAGFDGHQVYDRAFPVNGSTNNFKGLLYIYGANHGNWNSMWTPAATQEPKLTPTASLISETDQKLIGKSYLTSFFLASLKGWTSYRYFLKGEVTFTSLPSSITRIFQYQDPKRIFLNHYEEDNDLTTGSQPGVTNRTSGTFVHYVDYKFNDQNSGHFLWEETDGLIAGWRNENAAVTVTIPSELSKKISDYEFLAFRIGQTVEKPVVLNTPGANKDMSVQVSYGSYTGPEVQTSNYQPLPYPMVTGGHSQGGPKSVMQTIRIPLRDLVNDPRDLTNISQIHLKFNRHASGIVAIDELQFTD